MPSGSLCRNFVRTKVKVQYRRDNVFKLLVLQNFHNSTHKIPKKHNCHAHSESKACPPPIYRFICKSTSKYSSSYNPVESVCIQIILVSFYFFPHSSNSPFPLFLKHLSIPTSVYVPIEMCLKSPCLGGFKKGGKSRWVLTYRINTKML